MELKDTHYHEALFLDSEGLVAEGPGENFFMVKSGKIHTPPLGTILAGITRQTVMELAKDMGITVIEQKITVDEALNADEAFFTGTAAEVTPIGSINDHKLGSGGVGEISRKIRDTYLDVVYGRRPEYAKFLTWV